MGRVEWEFCKPKSSRSKRTAEYQFTGEYLCWEIRGQGPGPHNKKRQGCKSGDVEAWGSHKHVGGIYLDKIAPSPPVFSKCPQPTSFHYPTQISAPERTSNKKGKERISVSSTPYLKSMNTDLSYTSVQRGQKETESQRLYSLHPRWILWQVA